LRAPAPILVLSVTLLGACSSTNEAVCTALFATITVAAHDTAGHPVQGPLEIVDTIRRTGQAIVMSQDYSGIGTGGSYAIFDDNQLKKILPGGDSVRVSGAGAAGRFSADYVFGAPDRCHVAKLSGPDTVLVRP